MKTYLTLNLAICLALAGVSLAGAADLYVDANGAHGGDGSAAAPDSRITDAVGRARQLRASELIRVSEPILVHVAAGNCVGPSMKPTLSAKLQFQL